MRTRQIITNPIAYTGKWEQLRAYLAKMKTVVPITFERI